MRTKYKLYLLLIFVILSSSQSNAQTDKQGIRLGLNYGVGTQQFFPYNDKDYTYDVKGYRGQLTWTLGKRGVISYELQLEPGIFSARHQLLNEYYIQPADGDDYLMKRELFTKKSTITEYVVNFGMVLRYAPGDRFSFSLLASIGPMFSDTETERLARGFAFSDIGAIGVAYKRGKIMYEIRTGVRHVSNADLKMPNSGHNSSNIDFGISIFL